MRKRLSIAIGVIITSLAVASGTIINIFDPDAPRKDWPVLQAAVPAIDGARVVVGPSAHVSVLLKQFKYLYCAVAAHPKDPARLFAAVLHWRGDGVDLGGFYSDDGGATWQVGCDLAAPDGDRYSDPTVAFGPDGEVYLVHMQTHMREKRGAPLGGESGGKLVFRASPDGGRTWEQRAVVNKYIDRPWIAVDTTNGPHRGNLYCVGNIDEPVIYVSDDGARTLGEALTPLEGRKLINCRPANPAVFPDGTVLLTYQDRYVKKRYVGSRPRTETLRLTDGGKTVTRSTPVDTKWWHDSITSSPNSVVGADFPQLAADPGSRRHAGRVYCVWNDGQGDSTRIFFCASPDGGATWGRSVVISEQPMATGGQDEYMSFVPAIAVNNDGAIAVSWYDRRGLPRSKLTPAEIEIAGRKVATFDQQTDGWNVRLRVSLDGGATWAPSVQLNDRPIRGPVEVGHAAGLAAAADGRFHAVWIGNGIQAKSPNQLWSAAVQVQR